MFILDLEKDGGSLHPEFASEQAALEEALYHLEVHDGCPLRIREGEETVLTYTAIMEAYRGRKKAA